MKPIEIHFNISPKLVERLTKALERIADSYDDLHRDELAQARMEVVDDAVPLKVFYQSDRAVYDKEQEEKQQRIEEYGEEE